ncbi:hypothetical protein ACPV5U_23645 [Vibrio mediterranei]|uniref:hypothetical protein n=1 Tax=Vibrio mediterranei TaxID=689 RepID=UPI00148CF0CE|nr:hypothetical protein [Vibrio mediterranei]NOI26788.1 hypothetical protein [Vibrio mediterranei]
MSKNTPVINPNTGDHCFGLIPYISVGHEEFEAGMIQLREGKHFINSNGGFGVDHIWQRHRKEIEPLGYTTRADVAQFVADLIVTGTPIYCEFKDMRGNHKLTVVRSSNGIAVLEKKYTASNEVVYSVVTAFPNGKAHGTRIGSVG